MRNLINLLLCGLILLVFAKCNMHNNKSAQTVQQQEASEQNITQKENFNKFIVRFHSDSIFQISRSTEMLVRDISYYKNIPEYSDDLLWGKLDEMLYLLKLTDKAYYSSKFQKKYEFTSDSIALETLKMDTGDFATSSYIQCKYKLDDGLWIMEDFDLDVANNCF